MIDGARVALVTGAGRGIGRAVAVELARRGDAVVVNDVNPAGAAETVGGIEASGGRAIAGIADVMDAAAVAQLVERITAELGGVDVLVNNAGGAPPGCAWGPFADTSIETHQRFLDLNLGSAFICTHAVIGGMVARGYGKVACVSSISGILGQRGGTAYAAGKAGLIGFVASVAKEVAVAGVNVNAITIGNAPHPSRTAERAAELNQWNHFGREGRHDEFANAIAFLVSDEASYLSGSNLVVDGGTLRLATL